jgi:signal transduction histidine kinase
MNQRCRILYLESRPEAVAEVRTVLQGGYLPWEVAWVAGIEAFIGALSDAWNYDLLMVELAHPGLGPGQALQLARERAPHLPLVYLAPARDPEGWQALLRAGARDCVPWEDRYRLGAALAAALETATRHEADQRSLAAQARLGALLRATLDASSDGLLVTDLAGRISAYNRKFLTLCGIPEYVLAPMELERVLQFLQDNFTGAGAFLKEIRRLGSAPDQDSAGVWTTPDDRKLEYASRPFKPGSEVAGRVVGLRDVTERERQLAQLARSSAEDGRLLAAAGPGRVVLWYLDQGRLGLSANAGPLLGLPDGDQPGTREELERLVHPDDLDPFRKALDALTDRPLEVRLRRSDQAWIWTRWLLAPTGPDSWHGVFADVTGQRVLRDELDERRRLEWSSALAASLARVLRGPLDQLQAHLETLSESSPLTETQRLHLNVCAQAAGSLDATLAQLHLAPFAEPVPGLQLDLNRLVRKLEPWAAATLGPDIRLRTELVPDLPTLPQNPARLEPVLMNLVLNARDALGGAGTVQIRTGAAGVSGGNPGPSLFLEVEDSGPGIPPLIRERIFEPFFTTRPGAKGLGLATSRAAVESYGGQLLLDSAPMRGTRARVILPRT